MTTDNRQTKDKRQQSHGHSCRGLPLGDGQIKAGEGHTVVTCWGGAQGGYRMGRGKGRIQAGAGHREDKVFGGAHGGYRLGRGNG